MSALLSGLLHPCTLTDINLSVSLSHLFLLDNSNGASCVRGKNLNSETAASLSPTFFVCSLNLLLCCSTRLSSFLLDCLIRSRATLYIGWSCILKILSDHSLLFGFLPPKRMTEWSM